MKTGIQLISDERNRQIEVEGYDYEHDSHETVFSLIDAGICYADIAAQREVDKERGCIIDENWNDREIHYVLFRHGPYGWSVGFFKPTTTLRDLVKAGALIAAAIDRLVDYSKFEVGDVVTLGLKGVGEGEETIVEDNGELCVTWGDKKFPLSQAARRTDITIKLKVK